MSIVYASLCDGIGAAHVAWQPLGWRCAWTSEIEPFAAAIVEHHWNLPNLGDMTRITEEMIHGREQLDLVVGGTPCQSFSLAGLRKGLDDPRGNLALVFLRIVGMARPRWVVWENVPGVLSSSGGRDFGCFLGALGQLGYGWSYRILDARFFGVPQRRRRVFVVGHLGDWRPAAAVLLEPAGLRGDSAPRRKAGTPVARSLTSSVGGPSAKEQQLTFVDAGNRPLNALCFGGGNTAGDLDVATCLTHHGARLDFDTETFVAYPLDMRNAQRDADRLDAMNRQGCGVGREGDPAPACTAGPVPGVAYAFQPRIGRSGRGQPSDVVPALAGADAGATSDSRPCVAVSLKLDNGSAQPVGGVEVTPTIRQGAGPNGTANVAVYAGYAVRRLTPRECERLQGFPDDYTLIEYRGKPAADGPRYRALGNSMAVPVMRWIGRRIDRADALKEAP